MRQFLVPTTGKAIRRLATAAGDYVQPHLMFPKYIRSPSIGSTTATMPSIKPPKYEKGDDLTTWTRIYDQIAEMNDSSNKERLVRCPVYLSSELVTWVLYQTYSTWDDFSEALQHPCCRWKDTMLLYNYDRVKVTQEPLVA